MTAPVATEAAATSSDDAEAPATNRRTWRRFATRRTGVYLLVVGLGVVLLSILAVSAQRPTTLLDPEGVGPPGGQALAEVLRDQGVEVEVVRSIAALEATDLDDAATVFVSDPDNLGSGATVRLADAARGVGRLVLVAPFQDQLDDLDVPVDAFPGGTDDLAPRCSSPLARDDDRVGPSDTRFVPQGDANGAVSCFPLPGEGGEPDPDGSGSALVVLPDDGLRPETVLVGIGSSWTNEEVAADSNAGLAIRTLGSTPRLVWYQPGTSDLTAAATGGSGPGDEPREVAPAWVTPAVVLVGLAVVLLAVARGRRLGRLVREPLPVVVRAVETTESRGRLYRRSGDRARAATVLRLATRDRLSRRLAVPRADGEVALVHAVATASGLPAHDVSGILSGPAPADDAALIQLAQQLTDLEERVRHP